MNSYDTFDVQKFLLCYVTNSLDPTQDVRTFNEAGQVSIAIQRNIYLKKFLFKEIFIIVNHDLLQV